MNSHYGAAGGFSSAVVGKTLIFSGEIEDNFLAFLWENLLKKGADLWDKKAEKAREDRRLILNSTGGTAECAFSAVDLFEHVSHLTTVATGACMSGSIIVVAAGTPGCRFATPRTRFMVHSPYWDLDSGTRRHTEVKVKELKRIETVYAEILEKYTKKPKAFWMAKQRVDEGYFFDAEEARSLGIVDGIIKAPY